MRSFGSTAAVFAAAALCCPAPAAAQSAAKLYAQIMARATAVRSGIEAQKDSDPGPWLDRMRRVVGQYETLVRRYPRSGYSDNALYQAALLSSAAFSRFADDDDRRTALRLFKAVRSRYPSSSLKGEALSHLARLDVAARPMAKTPAPAPAAIAADERPVLKTITREVLPDALRVTLELGREAVFHEERIEGPPRVFIDLRNTRVTGELRDATLTFTDDVVKQIRVGRQQSAARVVLDLEGVARHSVFALYNPYRIVIDFERSSTLVAETPPMKVAPPRARSDAPGETRTAKEEPGAAWTADAAAVSPSPPPPPPPRSDADTPPSAPTTNRNGSFSLSRQLGLGVSRVVIDAGHGGHDPGARVKGLNEADLTLDVAQRLETLLHKVPGVEVVMTRRTNVYIPLDERTAIANRAGADLFLSIHANASVNPRARGIETYFLNFAPNPEAEALAARENAGSAKTMHSLPDIVKAIALNNKIDESRDFASHVQTAMFDRLRRSNRQARSLGVKQAPFMVLIGATMPSVLAEISFITNRQEGALLRTQGYRQAIAEALNAGIAKYQRSLKAAQAVADQ